MPTFQLTKEGQTFDFDDAGKVRQSSADVGTWTTREDNSIVLTRTGGAKVVFPVTWSFDTGNHLLIQVDGSQVHDFCADDRRPAFSVSKPNSQGRGGAVLEVGPDREGTFRFRLRGEWNLSTSHDLSLTVGDAASVIDGFIENNDSQFVYHFTCRGNNDDVHDLLFTGAWSNNPQDNGKLQFTFNREDGTPDTFDLPGSIRINGLNQFEYEYDRKSRKRLLKIIGTMRVSSDFQIEYAVSQSRTSDGKTVTNASTIRIQAQYNKDNLKGNLELLVRHASGRSTLAITGGFTRTFSGGKLVVGFKFERTVGNKTSSFTFGFNGAFQSKDGTTLEWKFAVNAKTVVISLEGSQFKLGKATGDIRFDLKAENGQIVGIRALFTFTFP